MRGWESQNRAKTPINTFSRSLLCTSIGTSSPKVPRPCEYSPPLGTPPGRNTSLGTVGEPWHVYPHTRADYFGLGMGTLHIVRMGKVAPCTWPGTPRGEDSCSYYVGASQGRMCFWMCCNKPPTLPLALCSRALNRWAAVYRKFLHIWGKLPIIWIMGPWRAGVIRFSRHFREKNTTSCRASRSPRRAPHYEAAHPAELYYIYHARTPRVLL